MEFRHAQRLGAHIGILSLFFALSSASTSQACTTAAWSAEASASHAPVIWKNRDTDSTRNRVVFVDEKPYKYVGLTDNSNSTGRMVYAGLNERGFAIFNSVAYNVPAAQGDELKDLEGAIMADALRTSSSVADFESYLKRNLGPDLGAQANFIVYDASGDVWLYEVHNHGFEKFSVNAAPQKYLVNTNYSRSGKAEKGSGYLRFDRATQLIEQHKGLADLEFILNGLSRDFRHTLLKAPSLDDLAKTSVKTPEWYASVDTIDRESTAAAVVIEGKVPGKTHSTASFWVMLGEPVSSLAVPIWVESGRIPAALSQGTTVAIQQQSLEIKGKLRPGVESEKLKYINLSLLQNKEGTGILPILMRTQKQIIDSTRAFLSQKHSAEEMADFQDKMANLALDVLRKINQASSTSALKS